MKRNRKLFSSFFQPPHEALTCSTLSSQFSSQSNESDQVPLKNIENKTKQWKNFLFCWKKMSLQLNSSVLQHIKKNLVLLVFDFMLWTLFLYSFLNSRLLTYIPSKQPSHRHLEFFGASHFIFFIQFYQLNANFIVKSSLELS
jgi:hypothetical protein